MKRRALLLLLASSACRNNGAEEQPLTRALLAAAQSSGRSSAADVEQALAELEHLGEMARVAVVGRGHLSEIGAVAELVFGRLGFEREVEDKALDFVFLPSVLARRRGSCVGLGTLFLALAEQLGWSAAGVMMPGHFYVRVNGAAGHQNVELLHAGEVMPDAWYEHRFPIPGGAAPEYARPLQTQEVMGVLEYNVGNALRRAGRLPEASVAFTRASVLFPDFAEAYASLGAVAHLLGELDQAASSYRKALSRHPALPGVRENMALLAAERQGESVCTSNCFTQVVPTPPVTSLPNSTVATY
jgi:regulator of sirC expression with transglutaminase-like and TPR domain